MLSTIISPVFTNAVGTIEEHPQGYAIVRYHPVTIEIPALRELLTHLGRAAAAARLAQGAGR